MPQTDLMSKNDNINRASWCVLLASAVTLVLYLVPFLYPIAYPFLLLSTLVHEMGHGIAAILMGGRFLSFKMWLDGSGVANISGDFNSLATAFVAAAGLLGPPITAAFSFFVMKSKKQSRILLASFGIILIISIMLVVRNLFGVFFVGLIAGLCFYFSLGSGKNHCQLVLAFFATQLALSVFSRSDYLFKKTAMTSAGFMPSDVAQIADALFFPYWFWGALCGLFSVVILFYGLRNIFR